MSNKIENNENECSAENMVANKDSECNIESDFVFVEGNDKVSDFYIRDHQVTQAEYRSVMRKNPSFLDGDNNPVECVSWYDAIKYCNKLSEKEGLTPCYIIEKKDPKKIKAYIKTKWSVKFNKKANGYRLPTETEWEYAARGGNKSKGFKCSGSDKLDYVAWSRDNSGYKTHPVKQKQPDELGIYDMSGNVWEWCWDWYNGNNYPNSAKDYAGPSYGRDRVFRGGSFNVLSNGCAVGHRISCCPDIRINFWGFRLVRSSRK